MKPGFWSPSAGRYERQFQFRITYWSYLAGRMARGMRLVKTHTRHGVSWSVGKDLVDPELVREEIASGRLIPSDPGLFGTADTAQTYRINPKPRARMGDQ